MNPITTYFEGERLQCLIGVVLALAIAAVSLYILIYLKTSFYKGIAYPGLALSLLLVVGFVSIVLRSPGDIARVSAMVEQRSEKLGTEELPRMEKVMRNFGIIKTVEIIVFAAGLCLLAFAPRGSAIKGLGLALAVMAVLLFGFDHLAQKRGAIYLHYLQSLRV